MRFIDPDGMRPDNPQDGDYDEESDTYYSERFGWVSQQFYSFLVSGGYKFKDDAQVRSEFYKSIGLDGEQEETYEADNETSNNGAFGTPRDYYAEGLSAWAGVVGEAVPFMPFSGSVYSYANDQTYGDASLLLAFLGIAIDAMPGGSAAKGGKIWVYGAFKTEAKWANQFSKRGWTVAQVTEAITKGKSFKAVNMVNKANGATRYVHPTTGKSIVIDNVTKELLQVGGEGFKW